MSFIRELYENFRDTFKLHTAETKEIYPHEKNGIKMGHSIMPHSNYFSGIYVVKPSSGITSSTLISSQSSIDYWVKTVGVMNKIVLRLNITLLAAVQLSPIDLINRIEIHGQNQIIFTIYPENLLFNRLHDDFSQVQKRAIGENFNPNTFLTNPALVAGTYEFNIDLQDPISRANIKSNGVSQTGILYRVFYSTLGVLTGLSTDVVVNTADLVVHNTALSPKDESNLLYRMKNEMSLWRVLSPVKVCSQTLNLTPSSFNDYQLISANTLSSWLVFVVRPMPLNAANNQNFIKVASYELYDSSNQLVGSNISHEHNTSQVSKLFNGYLVTQRNIYVVPFALNPSVSLKGVQNGFYAFSTRELLRIYTTSTLVAGSYRVDVFSMDYNMLVNNKGELSVKK